MTEYGEQEYVCQVYDLDQPLAYFASDRCQQVVRCRDCKRFAQDDSDHDYRSGWWCKRWDTDMVKPDGFCAWGERRRA